MSKTVLNCHVEPGRLSCAFMPTSLDSRSHSKLSFNRVIDSKSSDCVKLTGAHPQNTKIMVEGTVFNPSSCKYAVGVFEEGSSTMSLREVSPFSVQAVMDGIVSRNTGDNGEASGVSYFDKKKDLINTYAPVKKQRQLRAAVNATVSDEKIEGYQEALDVMKQTLKSTTDKPDAPEKQQAGIIGQMRDLLPPFDLSATTPSAVYDFSTLFPVELIASLDPTDTESTCHALLKWTHEDFVTSTDPEDLFAEVKSLKTIGQLGRLFFAAKQEKRKSFAKLLNILISMIYLYKLRKKKQWTAFDLFASEPLGERLGQLYSPDKCVGGTIDREGANKLFAHIAIFVLRLTPYWEFDFSDLKVDLNVQTKDLLSILSFCGISVKQGKAALVGVLKAPLAVYSGGHGQAKRGAKRK